MVFVKQAVQTPYGQGIVEQVADLKITVRPTTWLLANNQKPIFFMNPKDVKPFFDIGDRIKCAFGVGVVESIRDSDGIYIVKLLNWALADGKSPTLYLNEQALSKESKVVKPETKQISFDDVYPFSLQLKDSAKELFQQKKFTEAKTKYTDALERMRTIELELTNEQKARFIEMSVYCHTNLALCAFYESDFPECIRYGESTINLIEAIEKQDSTSVLIVSLQASGVTSEKLRDQKAKVWKIIAKAEVKRQNFENAQRLLKSALAICTTEKAKKEVNDLLVDVTKKLAQEKKKEKSMWQKAFEKGSEEGLSPPSSPTKKPQPANGHSSTVPTNAISSATTSNVATDEKFADFESEFSKRFASIDVSTNKKPKSTKVAAKSKDQQVVSSTFWSSERFFNTLYLTFAVGAVGGLIFWWQQRLKR